MFWPYIEKEVNHTPVKANSINQLFFPIIARIAAVFWGIQARSSSFLRHGKKYYGKLGQIVGF
jgi:hypothetical protein